jgi:phospholipase/carboxylesterase
MNDSFYVHRVRPAGAGNPILFALHGMGGDENSFFKFAGRLLPEATIVTPRGDIMEGDKTRFYRRNDDNRWDEKDLSRATEKLKRFIGEFAAEHGASKILGFGYSNGANMLAHLLIEKGDIFDAAALLHPSYAGTPDDNAKLAGRPILITAGEKDDITPVSDARLLTDYFLQQEAKAELFVHGGDHGLCPLELERLREFMRAEAKA